MVESCASHDNCVVCSTKISDGLKLTFHCQNDGSVFTSFTPQGNTEGYSGQMHGGLIATILDSAMVHVLFSQGIEAVTADLHVRYMHPIRIGESLKVSAKLIEAKKKLYLIQGEVHVGERCVARSEGKFLPK
ncbi:PaaI family thioesterase [Pseudovibrio flavus]|uniref:PaaI family thioesterase n=1 Tax=Pseudovibrio flavus TaxID=2529854 RepID=UPI003528CCCF